MQVNFNARILRLLINTTNLQLFKIFLYIQNELAYNAASKLWLLQQGGEEAPGVGLRHGAGIC